MNFATLFRQLLELQVEGGFVICTYINTQENSSKNEGCNLLIKTIIQPDADILNILNKQIVKSQDYSSYSNLIQKHFEKIKKNIRLLQFTRWAFIVLRIIALAFGVVSAVNFYRGFSFFDAKIIWAILVSALFFFLKHIIRFILELLLKFRPFKLLKI